jgi:ketosteroid isomerase-like protein
VALTTRNDFDRAIEAYHTAADKFSRGNPEPVKTIFSHRDDVTLANPFGPAVCGRKEVSEALDQASSRFRDGEVGFETIASYVTTDLATILELDKWKAKVGGNAEVAAFELRVTSTFRREDDMWKLVHRHADPISTYDPRGPLRVS